MKLHGSLQTNLEGALMSARRHRDRPVYPQTLAHWNDLLAYARREIGLTSAPAAAVLSRLATDLEAEIAARESSAD
jgi:hypothetical protein